MILDPDTVGLVLWPWFTHSVFQSRKSVSSACFYLICASVCVCVRPVKRWQKLYNPRLEYEQMRAPVDPVSSVGIRFS